MMMMMMMMMMVVFLFLCTHAKERCLWNSLARKKYPSTECPAFEVGN